jgi:hypothetical protein
MRLLPPGAARSRGQGRCGGCADAGPTTAAGAAEDACSRRGSVFYGSAYWSPVPLSKGEASRGTGSAGVEGIKLFMGFSREIGFGGKVWRVIFNLNGSSEV